MLLQGHSSPSVGAPRSIRRCSFRSRLVVDRRRLSRCRSVPEDGEASSGDIDSLARLLSQQAAKLRASIGDEELRKSYDGFDEPTSSGLFGLQAYQLEERVFREIGPGFLYSDDFEVLQQLGRISVMRSSGSSVDGTTAVIAYAARFLPRLPMQRPLTVLLKEYLPVAKAVAFNELLVMSKLCGLPEDQYSAANRPATRSPPIVPLLGYFVSAPTEEAASLSMDAEADSVWLVYKWEGLRPLNMYLTDVRPPEPARAFFKKKEVLEAEAWRARRSMLRSLARALLGAVAYCHGAGVTHGSLSTGTIFISSFDDADAGSVFVKLDNFGFGRLDPAGAVGAPLGLSTPQLPGQDIDSVAPREGRRHDLQATAITLLEVFSAGTSEAPSEASSPGAPSPAASPRGLPRTSITRLLFDIYSGDPAGLRAYCADDPGLGRLVELLDEGPGGGGEGCGWDFLSELVKGSRPAEELLLHPFLALA